VRGWKYLVRCSCRRKQEAKRLLFGPFAIARWGEGRVGEGGGRAAGEMFGIYGEFFSYNDIHYFM
jgi:hypothetical protein